MTTLKIQTLGSAPAESVPFMEESIKQYGMLANLTATLAGSPGLIEAYQTLHELFAKSSFNNDELTVVWQTINVENECHYCVPAHTAIAGMMKVAPEITNALRNETALPNEKLEALRTFTLVVLLKRGHVSDAELETFYAAGYNERSVLDVILGVAQKTISNYTNHIANTPVDKPFQNFAWEKK